MIEPYRIKNNLQEWNRLPAGYTELSPLDKVQPFDVMKISDEWYVEYPPKGGLVGLLRGQGGKWYRKEQAMTSNQLKDILDGITEAMLKSNARIDKLEAAQPEAQRQSLSDGDYVLDEGAGWFDVGPFTVRMNMRDGRLNIRVYDRKLANDHDFEIGELEHFTVAASECE